MLGKFAGKVASGPVFFAVDAYNNGIVSATKDMVMFNAAMASAKWGAARLGLTLAHPLVIGAAVVAGGALAGRALLQQGNKFIREQRKFSMGNNIKDTYGTISTMRQASIQAIQSSKVNGRNALGNEGYLMHM